MPQHSRYPKLVSSIVAPVGIAGRSEKTPEAHKTSLVDFEAQMRPLPDCKPWGSLLLCLEVPVTYKQRSGDACKPGTGSRSRVVEGIVEFKIGAPGGYL